MPSKRAYDFLLTLCSCRLVVTSVYVGVLFCTNFGSELKNWKRSHLPHFVDDCCRWEAQAGLSSAASQKLGNSQSLGKTGKFL